MKILKVDYRAENAAELFTRSLKDTGFGVLTNHPIDMQLVNDVYKEWQSFFVTEDKNNYLYDEVTQAGYFPMEKAEKAKGFQLQDIKEYYQIYSWAKLPESISSLTTQLYNELTNIAHQLLFWIERCAPAEVQKQLSIPLSDMIKNSQRTMFRVLHYPPIPDNVPAGSIRAAAHGDINLITVLPAATNSGLQVKDSQGQWLDVPCDANSLIINVGDMLEMASNNYYKSTMHRVINPDGNAAKQSRLSMPLFLHPCDDVVLSETHTASDYLLERLKELGSVDQSIERLAPIN